MTVPYTFASRTSSIPLSELDQNFATVTTLGNATFQMGNTVTTVGNLTLTNVTISSGDVTLGNVTYTGTLTGGTGVVNIGSGQIYKDASGNLGVGTSSPTSKLTVLGADGVNSIRFRAATGMLRINPYQDATEGTVISAANAAESANIPLTISASLHRVTIGGTEVARIDASGNLGIGTTNPAYKFVVSNGGASGIEFGPAFSGTANLIQSYNRSSSAYVNTVYDAAEHQFNISGSERMRLDASGNLITNVNGTAPSLSANSTMSFELTSNTSLKIVVRGTDGVTRSATLTLS